MELDELKSTWQALNRQLEQQVTLNRHAFLEGKLDKVRTTLRPLYWGKIVQILFGDALIYFGIMSTIRYHDTPHLLACSVFMAAYGLLIVVFAGVTIGRISSIDYAAPVLEIQKRVGVLHRFQAISNLCLGLPWWFLWFAIFMLEMKANLDVDLYAAAPSFVWANIAIGIAGLIATVWFYRRRREKLDAATTPRSLREAKRRLDEIARFEQP